jgi:DnaJ-class molecular chaperone
MPAVNNPYDTLGVSKTATDAEIKQAYRKLAMKWHPDHNKDKDATSKFQEISSAYAILSDPVQRRQCDMGAQNIPGFPGSNADMARTLFEMFRGQTATQGNMFDVFFGNQQVPVRQCACNCTLEQLATRAVKKFRITRTRYDQNRAKETVEVAIQLEPHWTSGYKITYEGKGDILPDGRCQRLQFVINVQKHALFSQRGEDLLMELQITLKEALCGAERVVTGVMGEAIPITSKTINPQDKVFLPGHGMPRKGRTDVRGGLIVSWRVVYPKLTDEQIQRVNEIL